MPTPATSTEVIFGREREMRRLREAVQNRQSHLIWGSADAGKTFLVQRVIATLSDSDRRKCICWSGAASGRQLVSHFLRGLYLARDPLVQRKMHADRSGEFTLDRWINKQSWLRLRGILFSATEQGDYRFFVDHLPPATQNLARLLKQIMYRCKTPVYLTAHGYSQEEIGYAWSLYWTDEYRIRLEPLTETPARKLLELCIRKFGLTSLDLAGFRDEILRCSGRLPGSIVKMCELAADARYHYGDRIKIKLVLVDYLMQSNPPAANRTPNWIQ